MFDAAIIIPCYNEADRLPLEEFIQSPRTSVLYLFVDDGSSDRTSEILSEISVHAHIEFLVLPKNGGKAEAVRQGMLHLMKNASIKYFGFLDADLATPISSMLELQVSLIEDEEQMMILGSRWKHLGGAISRNEMRHYTGRIFATFVSNTFQLGVYDTQCGAKWFRREVVQELFTHPFKSKWFFDVELLLRLQKIYKEQPIPAKEIPLSKWTEIDDSKIRWTDFIKAPLELRKIKKYYQNWLPPKTQSK